jgi:cold shock CspA family protein
MSTSTGVVKRKRAGETYGFISPQGGGVDYFFHVKNCIRIPQEGDEVSYSLAPDERHPDRSCAVDVTPLEREAA